MLNSVNLMGRLVADPELRQTQTGVAVCSFRIAVDRNFTGANNQRETDFLDIVAWRKTAEFVTKYFGKGAMIIVQGSIQTRNYEDKNGNKRTAVEVVADSVLFGEKKQTDPAGAPPPQYAPQSAPPQQYAQQPAQQPQYAPQPAQQQYAQQPAPAPYGAAPQQQYAAPPPQAYAQQPAQQPQQQYAPPVQQQAQPPAPPAAYASPPNQPGNYASCDIPYDEFGDSRDLPF